MQSTYRRWRRRPKRSYLYWADNSLCWSVAGDLPGTPSCTAPPSGATVYTHDANGNMTSGGGKSFTYNAKDQTTKVNDLAMDYADATQDERVAKGDRAYASNLLGVGIETKPVLGVDPTTLLTDATYYTRDDGGLLLSQRVKPAGATSATSYYYLLDGLGSVVGMTDGAGTLQNTYEYDPYGQQVGGSQGSPTPGASPPATSTPRRASPSSARGTTTRESRDGRSGTRSPARLRIRSR